MIFNISILRLSLIFTGRRGLHSGRGDEVCSNAPARQDHIQRDRRDDSYCRQKRGWQDQLLGVQVLLRNISVQEYLYLFDGGGVIHYTYFGRH